MEQPKTGKPDTTSQTHILFLDLLEVEDTHNVEVVVNPAEKCSANPVLPLGDVGEWDFRRASNWGGTTIFDEDEKIFKMWYIGQGVENDDFGQGGDFDVRKEDPRVPEPKTGAFVGDIRLAVNRDGVGKFRRVNMHQPVVARGEKGAWDSASLVTSAPIVHGDTIYIFYSAVDESGGASPNAWLENIPCPIRTGLATLRLDGFTCLQSRDRLTPATVTTVPISVKGPKEAKLILNASDFVPYRDWIEVEVLDAGTGSPVAGYGREDCTDVVREGIRIPVAWGERDTLEGVTSEEIQLRFTLYGRVRLYSFTFTS